MADSIDFFIDNKPYTTYKATQSIADILAIADLSADSFFLISPTGVKYSDAKQTIEIHSDDCFTTEKRDQDSKPQTPTKLHYQVNGEQLTTIDPTLSVEQILRSAGKSASIDLQQLSSYILENIETDKKYENLDDIVNIVDGDKFLAVHSGATPVARFL